MKLQAYLDRIQYSGPVQVDVDTLRGIHKRHLAHIPYENVDVQLRRPVSLDINQIFEKIVSRKRGGWCYEMNGLLAWALVEIGFTVRKLAGGVMRQSRGDAALGNHLVLLVTVDEVDYVADVGFGDGLYEPVPLQEGRILQRGLGMRFEKIDGGYWRFHNHIYGGAPSFDFNLEPASTPLLQRQCLQLQTNSVSPFRMALVCQMFTDRGIEVQLGLVSKSITHDGVATVVLDSKNQFLDRLEDVFGIHESALPDLWPTIVAQHKQFFGE